MKKLAKILSIAGMMLFLMTLATSSMAKNPKYKVLVLTERGGQHESFTAAALQWLTDISGKEKFEFTEINNTKKIDEEFLSQYKLFIQLDFPPYTWSDASKAAFVKYIEEGRGGWIGFHHATLLGDFDGYPMWNWFSDFMGSIMFQNYIAELADGTIRVEDSKHPVMRGVSDSFTLKADEWYTFNKNPRPNVHVLANVDEGSYNPASTVKMGDHPAIWVNENLKARNVYFIMGHSSKLFDSQDFKIMFQNAIRWASSKK